MPNFRGNKMAKKNTIDKIVEKILPTKKEEKETKNKDPSTKVVNGTPTI